jgi:hypothetical protein
VDNLELIALNFIEIGRDAESFLVWIGWGERGYGISNLWHELNLGFTPLLYVYSQLILFIRDLLLSEGKSVLTPLFNLMSKGAPT